MQKHKFKKKKKKDRRWSAKKKKKKAYTEQPQFGSRIAGLFVMT
jgi:hypothetical protein